MCGVKLAVIGTTINGEEEYLEFDRLAKTSKFSDVVFIIAGDRNSKPFDTKKFQCRVEYLEPGAQERFSVSPLIGWKTPRRRPVAWLRAIELTPDFVLSVDDDNIPPADYFERWHEVLTTPKASLVVLKEGGQGPPWHNYLSTSNAPLPIYPRGYPTVFRGKEHTTEMRPSAELIAVERIGLFQGISLGDPDIDAMSRIVFEKPIRINSIQEKNYCLHDIWSPYNMQNTVLSKTLFPLPILWPLAGRFDDIYASFAWQKLLFNNSMFVHVGDPLNRQDRGSRDIFKADFLLEVEGYTQSHEVWGQIASIEEKDGLRFLEKLMILPHEAIQRHRKFFEAYRKDFETVMK